MLFCDLVGSTPLSQQLDAEEWRDLIAQYQQAAAGAVARFGGHVAKNLGDGLLIYFGWPTAREDDPERAVRAGLAIVEAVHASDERLLPSPPPLPEMATEEGTLLPSSANISVSGGGLGWRPLLSVRVGMHTGPVVIADGGEVFGETANIAARVQGAAEPDTVVITAATQRLVAGMCVVEDRGPQMLKGVREPVTLYRVVQPSGVRSRLDVAAGHLTRFVGREVELTTLVLCDGWCRISAGRADCGRECSGAKSVGELLRRSKLPDLWKTTSAEVVKDTGWTAGTFQDSSKGSDGKTVAKNGKYVCVWRKRADGKWKAIRDIWNYDSK